MKNKKNIFENFITELKSSLNIEKTVEKLEPMMVCTAEEERELIDQKIQQLGEL